MRRHISVAAGLGLKVLALVAKLYFLLRVAPQLADGIFSTYFILSTAALLFARTITGGLLEHLPTLIRGKQARFVRFVGLLRPIVFLLLVIVSIGILTKGDIAGAIALAAAIALSNTVAGLKRSVTPWVFDLLGNAPWLIFLVAIISTGDHSAEFLLKSMAMSYCLIAALVLSPQLLKSFRKPIYRAKSAYLVSLWQRSHFKLASSLLQILQLRGAVIVAGILWANKESADELALSLAIAEGAWQFFMVLNNRYYVEYCQQSVAPISIRRRSVLFFSLFAIFSAITWFIFINNIGWQWIGESLWMAILVAGISLAWINIRYYMWSIGLDLLALRCDVIAVVCQAVLLLSPLPPLLCSAFALAVLPIFGWYRLRKPTFD